MACQILYSAEAIAQIRALKANQRALLRDQIAEQLAWRPDIETTNRKPLRPNLIASWELRVDDLRVYYDLIDAPQEPSVLVVAVGVKVRNRVFIAGEELQL